MGSLMNTAKNLLFYVLLILNRAKAVPIGAKDHVPLIIFGDSLYCVGNNNYISTTTTFQANFFPYGETYFNFPTGRFSNGRLIPDFICEYAKLPLIPPYLEPGVKNYEYGVNFASASAGTLTQTFEGFVIDFHTQLSYFKKMEKQLRHKFGAKKAKKLISSAVYLINIGANDYVSPFVFNPTLYNMFSKEEYIGMVLGNFTQVIEGIYKVGGRKFGFLTLPPMGCSPGLKALQPGNTGACFEKINTLTKLHNKALPKTLKDIQTRLEGFVYSVHDLSASMAKRMENPEKYGFKEVNVACCGSGPNRRENSCGGKRGIKEFELCEDVDDYFFFDSGHISEKANKQLSEMMWSGDSHFTKPYNLQQLFQL